MAAASGACGGGRMVGGAVAGGSVGGVGMRVGGGGKAAGNGDGTGAAAATVPLTLGTNPCSIIRIKAAGMRYSRRAARRRMIRRVVGMRGMLGRGKG